MFEGWGPGALIGELEVCQRQESVLIARRMAVIAQLLAHRVGEAEDVDPDPGYSMISGFARTAAEVAAVMNMTPMAATEVVAHAEALDVRLPAIAGLLAAGRIDGRSAALIITRTELVSVDRIAEVDSRLAARIGGWSSWSRRRLIIAVDSAVHAVDPDAVKQRRVAAHDERFLRVAADADGMARVRGSVPATAGAALDARLSELAGAVCAADPRTMAQRRADALLALVQGRVLGCGCPRPDCPTRTPADPGDSAAAPAGGVRTVISVIATGSTVAGDSDQPGYLQGYGVIDAAQVRALAGHAALRILEQPTVSAAQAVRYQPGAALQRWIRARDLTCRFPGCDRPAALCDIDHTIPFNHDDPAAGGLTVPDNLACYCRQHHRLKTFYAGPGGWRDEQLPDGTLVWTSPTGRTYRTTPGGPELFPDLGPPVGAAPAPRRRHRHRDKAARIARRRDALRAQRPLNAARRDLNAARAQEIDLRKWRNNMRKMRLLFKGTQPSTSPYCTWINDPPEPEELPPHWTPPPPPPQPPDTDQPPPF